MWILAVAVVLGALKTLAQLEIVDVAGISAMSWWWVLGGFGLTAAWWCWADFSGMSRRRAEAQQEERKARRLQHQKEQMGTLRRPK